MCSVCQVAMTCTCLKGSPSDRYRLVRPRAKPERPILDQAWFSLGGSSPAVLTPGGSMRFLLTSAGIKNASIHEALVALLGKPIAESNALCIPTAAYGHPMAGPGAAWRF